MYQTWKKLNLQSFIEESGLLEEVQRITKRTDGGLPDEENIIEEFKKNFLILFSVRNKQKIMDKILSDSREANKIVNNNILLLKNKLKIRYGE